MADPTVRNISNFLENHLRSYGCERLLHYEDVVNAFDKGRKVRSEDRLIVHAMQLKALAEFYRK